MRRTRRHASAQRSRPSITALSWGAVVAIVATVGVADVAHASALQRHGAFVQAAAAKTAAAGAEHEAIHGSSIGIISHRGAAAIAPENTLAAMRIAFARGVDFVELDVQLTADRVPVLMHDETVSRTTNGGGRIKDWTLAELQTLDAGSWFSSEHAGEIVPTFESFIEEFAPTTSRALIELKGEWALADIDNLAAHLRAQHLVDRVALQSFELETLVTLREVAPEFARVMLTRDWDEAVAQLAIDLQVSGVGARAKLYEARPELIAEVQELGIGTLVYTLNAEPQWAQAVERGVDLVVTDDPVSFAAWRDR